MNHAYRHKDTCDCKACGTSPCPVLKEGEPCGDERRGMGRECRDCHAMKERERRAKAEA